MASVCTNLVGVEGARVEQGVIRSASELPTPFPSPWTQPCNQLPQLLVLLSYHCPIPSLCSHPTVLPHHTPPRFPSAIAPFLVSCLRCLLLPSNLHISVLVLPKALPSPCHSPAPHFHWPCDLQDKLCLALEILFLFNDSIALPDLFMHILFFLNSTQSSRNPFQIALPVP